MITYLRLDSCLVNVSLIAFIQIQLSFIDTDLSKCFKIKHLSCLPEFFLVFQNYKISFSLCLRLLLPYRRQGPTSDPLTSDWLPEGTCWY